MKINIMTVMNMTLHNNKNTNTQYDECRVASFIVILCAVMLSAVMLSAVMLSAVMLSAVMLNAVMKRLVINIRLA